MTNIIKEKEVNEMKVVDTQGISSSASASVTGSSSSVTSNPISRGSSLNLPVQVKEIIHREWERLSQKQYLKQLSRSNIHSSRTSSTAVPSSSTAVPVPFPSYLNLSSLLDLSSPPNLPLDFR